MKYLIAIMFILAGCSTKSTTDHSAPSSDNSPKSNSRNLAVIDVTKKHPEKTVYIQDLADIEYIPLETNDSILLSKWKPDAISEQHIVFHNQNGLVLIFSRQGKMLYSFNRTGGGPEEYNLIDNIVLDKKKEELYIMNSELDTKIYVYSIDGIFKRKLNLPIRKFIPRCLIDYDKDYLFCYDSFYMDMTEGNMSTEDVRKRDNPYYFISKQTGEIIPLDYNIPNRIGNKGYKKSSNKLGENGIVHQMIGVFPLTQSTPDILITEFADDTLYTLKNGTLLPIMIKKPSAHKMNPPMLVGIDFLTDRYVFIGAVEKIFDGSKQKQISMVYDKQSNDFYQLNLLNKDYSTKRFINMYGVALLHNTGLCIMEAEYLLRDYKAGKLKGKLKEIASKLNEDDNQVLMLIKFKE